MESSEFTKKVEIEVENISEYETEEGLIEGLRLLWEKYPEKEGQVPPDNWMRKHGFSNLGACIYKYHGGFFKVRQRLGAKPGQKYKRGKLKKWNYVLAELKKVDKNHPEFKGELPSVPWLRKNGYGGLADGILKYHGGMREARKKLGQKQKRVDDGYWKDINNVVEEIVRIQGNHPELKGGLPSSHWLENNGYPRICYAIGTFHGGMREFRKHIGEPQV